MARGLLGCYLRSSVGGVQVVGRIVETEAYVGSHDPASHAAASVGRTPRNTSMFGPPGHAYIYRSYGIHWCLNVVTEPKGFPAAVLLRALEPVAGTREMTRRRGGKLPLCRGPGRLSQALGITGDLDGHCFSREPLVLCGCGPLEDSLIGTSGRIGIRAAAHWPLRFFLRGHPDVSGPPR